MNYKGQIAEEKAVLFLKKNGFKIIDRNFFCKGGEIDIIAFKDGVIHFIEVKSGNGFEPIYNITPTKIKRITKCIYWFLNKNKLSFPFCIDAIIIKNSQIDFLENITIKGDY